MRETVGERLRRLRTERRLTQRNIAGPGVSYAYISRIEAGTRTPSMKALRKLADSLGVSVEYLETGTDKTRTDLLLDRVRERIGDAPLELRVENGGVHARWSRVYAEPTPEQEAAGLSGGEGAQRDESAATLTEVLEAILVYEDRADRQDDELVAASAAKLTGRPRV